MVIEDSGKTIIFGREDLPAEYGDVIARKVQLKHFYYVTSSILRAEKVYFMDGNYTRILKNRFSTIKPDPTKKIKPIESRFDILDI